MSFDSVPGQLVPGSASPGQPLGGSLSISSADAGVGQEGDTEGYTSADTATGSETQGLATADTDVGSGTDLQALFILIQQEGSADGGSGSEAWATSNVIWTGADAGTGGETQSLPNAPASSDGGSGTDEVDYSIEVFPFPPPWLYNFPQGGFRLIWHPGWGRSLVWNYGLPGERTILRWGPGQDAESTAARFAGSSSHAFITDYDYAGGSEDHRPTATVACSADEGERWLP